MEFVRPQEDLRPGGEIDAPCTRCRKQTGHRIVAMVGNTVKRVICLACGSQHNFRSALAKAKSAGTNDLKAPRASRQRRVEIDPGEAINKEWLEKQNSLRVATVPKRYDLKTIYVLDDYIDHPTFGLGFVKTILSPQKIEVIFEREIKILAMNVVK